MFGIPDQHYNMADCKRECNGFRSQLNKAHREMEILTGQLETQKIIIQGKDEMPDLLRGGFNRPN